MGHNPPDRPRTALPRTQSHTPMVANKVLSPGRDQAVPSSAPRQLAAARFSQKAEHSLFLPRATRWFPTRLSLVVQLEQEP